jgi:DNA-binding transcriptional ArsR family regulator
MRGRLHAGVEAAELHLVLSDRNRRRILDLVLAAPSTVSDLTRSTRLHQPLVSHHLAVLRDVGLVIAVREGRFRRYQPASAEVVRRLREFETAGAALIAAGEKTQEPAEVAPPGARGAPPGPRPRRK